MGRGLSEQQRQIVEILDHAAMKDGRAPPSASRDGWRPLGYLRSALHGWSDDMRAIEGDAANVRRAVEALVKRNLVEAIDVDATDRRADPDGREFTTYERKTRVRLYRSTSDYARAFFR
jgi:hypothetical protein